MVFQKAHPLVRGWSQLKVCNNFGNLIPLADAKKNVWEALV